MIINYLDLGRAETPNRDLLVVFFSSEAATSRSQKSDGARPEISCNRMRSTVVIFVLVLSNFIYAGRLFFCIAMDIPVEFSPRLSLMILTSCIALQWHN